SNVIDVGYAGVIGAQRIATGVMPYGKFPEEDALKACGSADSAGEIRDRIQFNGRCESANPLGDTYGPVAYEAYLPGHWLRGSRGIFSALSGWTKFATLVTAPLWLTYPGPVRRPRPALAFAGGFALATVAAFSVLLLGAHPIQAAHTFYERTLRTQITRESPFS